MRSEARSAPRGRVVHAAHPTSGTSQRVPPDPSQRIPTVDQHVARGDQRVPGTRKLGSGGSRVRLEHRRALVAAAEIAGATLAAALAIVAWNVLDAGGIAAPWLAERTYWLPLLVGAWVLAASLSGAYSHVSIHHVGRWRETVALTATVLCAAYLLVYFVAPRTLLPRTSFILFVVAASVITGVSRVAWERVALRLLPARRVIIVGAGTPGQAVAKLLVDNPIAGLTVVGFVDSDVARTQSTVRVGDGPLDEIPVLGPFGALPTLARMLGVQEILVAGEQGVQDDFVRCVFRCAELGVPVTSALEVHESLEGRTPLEHLTRSSLVALLATRPSVGGTAYAVVKRATDITVAVAGLATFALMLPVVAMLIKLDSPGGIFYRQVRAGRHGRPITVWKLRTMVKDAEANGEAVWAASNDPRVTRVGRWLRRTRIDEFPQLWNVLRGQMRIIGPRPERPELDELLLQDLPLHLLRYAVPPGLTGWAQLRNGYVDDIDGARRRVEYDLYYLKNRSLRLDAQIMLRTLANIVTLGGR